VALYDRDYMREQTLESMGFYGAGRNEIPAPSRFRARLSSRRRDSPDVRNVPCRDAPIATTALAIVVSAVVGFIAWRIGLAIPVP